MELFGSMNLQPMPVPPSDLRLANKRQQLKAASGIGGIGPPRLQKRGSASGSIEGSVTASVSESECSAKSRRSAVKNRGRALPGERVGLRERSSVSSDVEALPFCKHSHSHGVPSMGEKGLFSNLDNFIAFNQSTTSRDALGLAKTRLRAFVEFLAQYDDEQIARTNPGKVRSKRRRELGSCAHCKETTLEMLQLWFHQCNRKIFRTESYFIPSENNMHLFVNQKNHRYDILILQFHGLELHGRQMAYDEPNLQVYELFLTGRLPEYEPNGNGSDFSGAQQRHSPGMEPTYMQLTSSMISSALYSSLPRASTQSGQSTGEESSSRLSTFVPENLQSCSSGASIRAHSVESPPHSTSDPSTISPQKSDQLKAPVVVTGDSSPVTRSDLNTVAMRNSKPSKFTNGLANIATNLSSIFRKNKSAISVSSPQHADTPLKPKRSNQASVNDSEESQECSFKSSRAWSPGTPSTSERHPPLAENSAWKDELKHDSTISNSSSINHDNSKILQNYEQRVCNIESLVSSTQPSTNTNGSPTKPTQGIENLKLNLPFENETFPAIFCPGFWYAIPFALWKVFLTEIMRCMKPGAPITTVMYDFKFSNVCVDESDQQFTTNVEFKKLFQAIRFEFIKRGLQLYPIRNLSQIFKQVGFCNVKYTVLSLRRGDFVNELGYLNEFMTMFHFIHFVQTFLTDVSKYPEGTNPLTLPKRYMDEHIGKIDDSAGCLRVIIISAEKPLKQ